MDRYTAKLFFQFRILASGASNKRRLCEERMILISASDSSDALALANRRGKAAQFRYRNGDGQRVFFEFIGVIDLFHIGIECDENEIWYDIYERLVPMERKKQLIPPKRTLRAIAEKRDGNKTVNRTAKARSNKYRPASLGKKEV